MLSEKTAQNPCSWTAKGSFSVAVPDDGTCDGKEFLSLFGNVGLDALGSPDARPLSRVFGGPFQENGLMNPWQVGPIAEEQELVTGPPMLRSFGKWIPVTSPSLEMSMRLERSVWANHLWNPTISAGVAYLILKTPGLLPSWQRGITNRPAEEVVSDIFACYLYGQRGAARCWKEAAYICWYGYGGRGTSNIRKTCPRICRLVCLGCRSKRPRCGVLHSRGTAKQRNGPRPPGDTDVFTSVRGSQGGRSTFITSSFSKQFESSTACLDPGSFVWRGCSTEFAQGISIMCGRSKSEDCGFSAKESCFIIRFSLDATSCCFSTDASTCLSTATSTRSFSAGVDSISCCTGQASFGGTSVWVIGVGYGAEAYSSKVPSATDGSWECVQFASWKWKYGSSAQDARGGFYAILAGCFFGRAYSYDSSTYPCWWICGHCSSYHTGRDCGAVGRFIS